MSETPTRNPAAAHEGVAAAAAAVAAAPVPPNVAALVSPVSRQPLRKKKNDLPALS